MRARDAPTDKLTLQARRKCELGPAEPIFHDTDRAQFNDRADSRAQGLGERLFGGEAGGPELRTTGLSGRIGFDLGRVPDPRDEAIAPAREAVADALHF